MTLTISAAHNEARLNGTRAYLDTGASNARVRIYSGSRPAPGGAPTLLLVEINLAKPCGVVSGGVLTLTSNDLAMVLNTGDATWARIVTASGDFAVDCDVSPTGGAGEVQLPSTQLYAGGRTEITSALLG